MASGEQQRLIDAALLLRRQRILTYGLVVVFLSMLALSGATIYLVNRANHNWCSLITTLDGVYTAQPPTTPTGRQVAFEIHHLVGKLGCPE